MRILRRGSKARWTIKRKWHFEDISYFRGFSAFEIFLIWRGRSAKLSLRTDSWWTRKERHLSICNNGIMTQEARKASFPALFLGQMLGALILQIGLPMETCYGFFFGTFTHCEGMWTYETSSSYGLWVLVSDIATVIAIVAVAYRGRRTRKVE